jgi:hypothetical protein
MDANMRKIMNHLYDRVECMGKILELSERKSEDDAVKEEIAKNKKYLENSDKFLANLETDTRKKMERYFENEKYADLFKNSAWRAAYNAFMFTDNLRMDKDIQADINKHRKLQENVDKANQELDALAKEQMKLYNRDVIKLNNDATECWKKMNELDERMKQGKYNEVRKKLTELQAAIDNCKVIPDGSEELEKTNSLLEAEKNYARYVAGEKKAQEYIEIEKQYKEYKTKMQELVEERDKAPNIRTLLKKCKEARKVQKQTRKLNSMFKDRIKDTAGNFFDKRNLNRGWHRNSKEYENMITALEELKNCSGGLSKMKTALEKLKQEATNYITEKNKQNRLLPSAMRWQRLSFAENIKLFVDISLIEMQREEIQTEMSKEIKNEVVKDNVKENSKEVSNQVML